MYADYDTFIEEMEKIYGEIGEEERVQERLNRLRQTKSVMDYAFRF